MNYKKKLEELKAFVLMEDSQLEEKAKAEVLAEEAPSEEVKEETPVVTYATAEQLSSVVEEMESFKNEMTEMLSAFAEMINATEKNKVPVEASADEVTEEVVEGVKEDVELSEQAPKPMIHDPEGLTKNRVKTNLNGGRKKTTEDIVFESLAKAGLWN